MDRFNQFKTRLSRREFLRLGGVALLGAAVKPSQKLITKFDYDWLLTSHYADEFHAAISATAAAGLLNQTGLPQFTPYNQGRVCDEFIDARESPSFTAKRTTVFWKDSVIPITSIAVSEDKNSHNLIWYQVGNSGYVHSGSVQPVRTLLNEVSKDIPIDGALAEVTVPFTDARWSANLNDQVAYRFYFETTHWVTNLTQDPLGNYWYAIFDDKYKYTYFAPAQHLRLILPDELSQKSSFIPNSLKKIRVFLNDQVLIAYEQDRPVFFARVATGAVFSTGTYTTPTGNFLTFHKRPSRHMAAGDIASNGYDLPGVPWISYITKSGIALHGTYWHNNFGRPRSHGCINLTSQASKWIYLWTNPVVPANQQMVYEYTGTSVEVVE